MLKSCSRQQMRQRAGTQLPKKVPNWKAILAEWDGLPKTGFLPGSVPQRTMLLDLKNLKCSACDAVFIYAPVAPRGSGLPLYCPECGAYAVKTA
jgi:hypothetical protein